MTKLMTPRTATLIGLTAILMWSLLAVMTVATGTVPAFQLAAMTFAIGALVGSLTWIGRPGAIRALSQPPRAWIVGVGGLFGYHALYFLALRLRWRSGRRSFLCLGRRHETRRYPRAGCCVLRDAAVVDLVPDSRRLRQAKRQYRACRDTDCRRRLDRGQGHGVEERKVGRV